MDEVKEAIWDGGGRSFLDSERLGTMWGKVTSEKSLVMGWLKVFKRQICLNSHLNLFTVIWTPFHFPKPSVKSIVNFDTIWEQLRNKFPTWADILCNKNRPHGNVTKWDLRTKVSLPNIFGFAQKVDYGFKKLYILRGKGLSKVLWLVGSLRHTEMLPTLTRVSVGGEDATSLSGNKD